MSKQIVLRIGLIFFMLFSLLSIVYSHTGHGEDSTKSTILPFHYFEEGSYIQGILIVVFWVLILKGIYELGMLVLARGIK